MAQKYKKKNKVPNFAPIKQISISNVYSVSGIQGVIGS